MSFWPRVYRKLFCIKPLCRWSRVQMSLADAARAAKTQFAPLTKDNLQQSKKELLTAANKLEEKLKEDKKNGDGWRKYTQLDKLLAQLGRPEAPDLAAMTAIYKKLAAGHEGLELVWFVDVREALRKYIWTAGASTIPRSRPPMRTCSTVWPASWNPTRRIGRRNGLPHQRVAKLAGERRPSAATGGFCGGGCSTQSLRPHQV